MTDESNDLSPINQTQENHSVVTLIESPPEDQINSLSFEPYYDDPIVTPLLYTSFEGPEGMDDGKCISESEESGFWKRNSTVNNEKKLWITICISLIFFCVELVGGWISGSLALLSDLFHLLSGGFFRSLYLTRA